MAAEPTQEKGRDGALRAKRWLDATTRVRISWDAYHSPAQVRIKRPDGTTQLYDLAGEFYLGGPPKPVLVESKNYAGAADQAPKYREYLADCYFATLDKGDDAETQFIWVTWHPFDQGRWPHLCVPLDTTTVDGRAALEATAALIEEAVTASGHLGSTSLDKALCQVVAQRLWLVVLSERQERYMTLDENVAAQVRERLLAEARL